MAVSNPLYKRLAGVHPERNVDGQQVRPKIVLEVFLAVLRARATGEITTDQAFNDRIGEVSYYQTNQAVVVPVGLDTTELAQANDLRATVTLGSTAANTAQRANDLIKIRETLMCLEFPELTGWRPDDMAGTTSVAGGKLNVIRRDGP